MIVIAWVLVVFVIANSLLILVRIQAPGGFAFWIPKLFSGAFSAYTCLIGLLGILLGLYLRSLAVIILSAAGVVISAWYVRAVTAQHDGFERAFGKDWGHNLNNIQTAGMLQKRWSWRAPASPEPRWEKDIPYWTVPGSERSLLCDIWQPPAGVKKSGLAFIYIHGSGWVLLDKDVGTRPFFRHLTSQGHVVMDAAYRLFPEARLNDMVGDVKRAVAWLRANAEKFGIHPERIVIGGGSAGGHLAMLAAYAADHPVLQYEDLKGLDCSVRGVISEYGPSDLQACYDHTQQNKTTGGKEPRKDFQIPTGEQGSTRLMRRLMRQNYERLGFNKPTDFGTFVNLLGGHPDQVPEQYRLYSPVTHVHPGCPPTLLIQGEYDLITSATATRELHRRLVESGVPAVNVILPMTDHGFDLLLPRISPPAQSSWYDVDRFLAFLAIE